MSKIQLVIFDMAGTTVRDRHEVLDCFLQAAERTKLKSNPDRVISMMGWSKRLVFQTLWNEQIGKNHPDYRKNVENSYQKFRELLETYYNTHPVYPTEGCLECFSWLKTQHIKIALTTGFYREVTNIILNRLGWDRGLNLDYVGSEDSVIQASLTPSEIYNEEGRPAPYMIQKAMYKLGIKNPQTVIKIGDTPSDLEAGINARCLLSLGVTNGSHTRKQLEFSSNHGLLESLAELKTIVQTLI